MNDRAHVKAKELVRDLREGFESNLERARLTTNSVTGLEATASAARMRIDDLESAIAADLAEPASDLRAKLTALRDRVANGIISGEMRETNKDYDSGATDVEIAVEAALTAILDGKG